MVRIEVSSAFSHLFLAGLLAGLFGSELQRHPTDFFPGGNATLLEPMNWIAVHLGQSLRHAVVPCATPPKSRTSPAFKGGL